MLGSNYMEEGISVDTSISVTAKLDYRDNVPMTQRDGKLHPLLLLNILIWGSPE